MPFWQPTSDIRDHVPWPEKCDSDTRTNDEWKVFCSVPFTEESGYETYVLELAKISNSYKDLMKRKNSKGVTALKILKNAASRSHYELGTTKSDSINDTIR